MTYLELVQRLAWECGTSGTPTTVLSQTGEAMRLVNWVADAWKEIQGRYTSWRWMRKAFTLPTVASTDTYAYGACTDVSASALISRFKRWWPDDFDRRWWFYLQSAGVGAQQWLINIDYDDFRFLYKFGPQQLNTGQPVHFAINDENKIVIGPNPNAIYVIGGEYQRSAQVLAADADLPEMPDDFHLLIVYRAMQKYATYESAADVFNAGVAWEKPLMRQLEHDQMPQFRLAGPLA